VVVNNATKDQWIDKLSVQGLPATLNLHRDNRGSGVDCNQHASGSTADYLLFMNPDLQLFPDSLSVPMEFMEELEHEQ